MLEISGLLASPEGLAAVLAVLRWTALAGFTVMTGTWVCACVCRPSGAAGQALGRVLDASWTAVWAGGLVVQLLPGPGMTSADLRLRAALFILLTAGWALARYVLVHPQARPRLRAAATAAAVLLALAASALWYLSEIPRHEPQLSPPPAAIAAHALKMAAITVWLGGLVSLGCMLIAEKEPRHALAAARRFSPTALICLHVLLGTVNLEAWHSLGKAPALLLTGYGRMLLAQFGALVLLLTLDALGRVCLAQQDPRDAAAVRPGPLRVVLHRSVAAQLAVGIALFAIAGPLPLVSPLPPIPAG